MSRLNDEQLRQLAGFTSNLGILFIAGVVAPLFSNIDGLTPVKVILGLVVSFDSITLSLLIAGGVKK